MARTVVYFESESSDEWGLFITGHHQFYPDRQRRKAKIQGKHGEIHLSGATYGNRVLTLDCLFIAQDREQMIRAWHHIAKKLSREQMDIRFSDDMGWRYVGTCYNAADLTDMEIAGEFTLVFDIEPFAIGPEFNMDASGQSGAVVHVDYPGNMDTCCRIVIRNTGAGTLNGLQLTKISRRE